MKVEKIIALLTEIEKKFEVENWMVDGFHVWPLIRLDLMMSLHFSESKELQIKINLLFKMRQAMHMLAGLAKYLIRSSLDRKNNATLAEVNAVILADGISRINLQGKWYDRFCDPLKAQLKKEGKTSLMIEPHHNYFTPRFSPSKFIQPQLDFSLLKTMFFRKDILKNRSLKGYPEFIAFLRSKNLSIPLPDEKRLRTVVIAIRAYADYYKKILRRVSAKQGFVVSFYGPRGLAFNLACRELGIPSADVQHGVAGESNPAYGKWSKMPDQGYEVLPCEFLCWSEEDKKAIERWNQKVKKHHIATVTGNLFVDLWKEGRFTDENIVKELKTLKKTKNILVTLSYVEEQNAALFENLLQVMSTSDKNWKWWIRPHPCLKGGEKEVENMLREKGISNFEMDLATNSILYALLPHMDLHITYASATVVEAAAFDVFSIINGEDGKNYFAEQIMSGKAVFADTPDEIVKVANSIFSKRLSA